MATRRLRRRRIYIGVAGITVCIVLAVVALLLSSRSNHDSDQVVIFGDSLAYQADPYFNMLVQASSQAKVNDFAAGGTAVCDWLTKMRAVAQSERPQVAVIEFSGNTFTSCMRGCVPESGAAVSRYCSDMATAVQIFLASDTRVILVGTPINYTEWSTHDTHWDDLNKATSALARRYPGHVTFVDAGRAVEGPGQSFVWMLPCLYFEPCTGPTSGGMRTNVVRSPDGVHFCVSQSGNVVGQVRRCSKYSSGAFRFAAAMASPVIRILHLSYDATDGHSARSSAD